MTLEQLFNGRDFFRNFRVIVHYADKPKEKIDTEAVSFNFSEDEDTSMGEVRILHKIDNSIAGGIFTISDIKNAIAYEFDFRIGRISNTRVEEFDEILESILSGKKEVEEYEVELLCYGQAPFKKEYYFKSGECIEVDNIVKTYRFKNGFELCWVKKIEGDDKAVYKIFIINNSFTETKMIIKGSI